MSPSSDSSFFSSFFSSFLPPAAAGAAAAAAAGAAAAGAAEGEPKLVKKVLRSTPFRALAKRVPQMGSTSLTLAAVTRAWSFSACERGREKRGNDYTIHKEKFLRKKRKKKMGWEDPESRKSKEKKKREECERDQIGAKDKFCIFMLVVQLNYAIIN